MAFSFTLRGFIFMVEICPYVGIWLLYYVVISMSWWHGYSRCIIYIFAVMFLIVETFMHVYYGLFEDVTSIS